MGSLRALDMAALVRTDELPLEVALSDHLLYNHFPPVGLRWLQPCVDAIAAMSAGRFHQLITPPDARPPIEACVLVESLHLDAFVYDEDTDDY
jgi:hypothetical protein